MDTYKRLNDLYQTVTTKKLPEMIELMNSKEIRKDIEKIVKKNDGDFKKIITLLNCAQTIFNYSGESTGMSDTEYDIIHDIMMNQFRTDMGITVPLVKKDNVVFHKYTSLRGTLDKIYFLDEDESSINPSRDGLPDWIKRSEKKIYETTGKWVDLREYDIYVFPKFDGVSGILEFKKDKKELDRALTRGYTETNEAQDISHILTSLISSSDLEHDYGLKTEIMMSEEDFERYNKEYGTNYKNSRSIVSSIVNSDEVDSRINYLKLVPLRVSKLINGEESEQMLSPDVFSFPYIQCKLGETEKIRNFAMHNKYANGLRCDGAVIYIIDKNIQQILGREDNKQKFEVAYKFTEESGYSKIKDIKFTIGLFGRITPVASINPIKLKGNTIDNISLGSYGRFSQLKLAKGDKVKVLYDIIPYCVMDESDDNCKRSGEYPIAPPLICPECDEVLELSETGETLSCVNIKCPCRKKGKILNYLIKMNIDGISYATIDKLYNEGLLKSIKDLYKLQNHYNELCNLDGFGPKSIDNILYEINSHRSVPASQLLGSLGIPSVSTKTFNKILEYLTFDNIIEYALDGAVDLFTVVPGIKIKTATKIVDGIKDNEKLILFLENELNIEEPEFKTCRYSVVFTKIRDKEMEKWIEENHGKVKDSLTKDVDILVVPMDGIKSSKVSTAEKYGIPVVSISNLKEYITNNLI